MASPPQTEPVLPYPDEEDDVESVPPRHLDESARKLFQRLWTEEDEIELLKGFIEHGPNDTAGFYDRMRPKLQLDFNKSQLVEKLRRLKKKYRNVVAKMGTNTAKDFAFKTAHDALLFHLSTQIWGHCITNTINNNSHNNNNNVVVVGDDCGDEDFDVNGVEVKVEEVKTPRPRKRARVCSVGDGNGDGNGNGLIEETVRSCLSPVVKEVLSGVRSFGGGAGMMSPLSGFGVGGFGGAAGVMGPFSGSGIGGFGGGVGMMSPFSSLGIGGGSGIMGSFSGLGASGGSEVDGKWRKQQILELEVYLKRIELVQEQVRVALEDLRSM